MSIRSSVVIASLLGLVVGVLGVSSGGAAAAPGADPVPTAESTSTPSPVVTPCRKDALRPAGFPRNGQPLANAPIGNGNYFNFPNRTTAERGVIMNRVINTVNSTWGTRYEPVAGAQPVECVRPDGTVVPAGTPYVVSYRQLRGTIKMTTWTFNHGGVRDALVNAEERGVSVQIIAAASVNRYGVNGTGPHRPWYAVRDYLRANGADTGSYAWECGGACRGSGGAPHSKYFLFTDVGSSHISNIVVQSSSNLTAFAVRGQWNQATALRANQPVYADFLKIFNQSKPGVPGSGPYYPPARGFVTNIFFPKGGKPDPVIAALNRVRCAGGTRVRAIQYAIHGTRGNAVAKKLRRLWNAGCNVRMIYSISSRPVLKILRSPSGRGRMPVRQSVIKNRRGEIVKYNHSKWLAIAGNYGGSRGAWFAHSGASNWSDIAFRSDEQMQELRGYGWVRGYFAAFDKTWRQKTSRVPAYGRVLVNGRMLPGTPVQPTYGSGIYKYMSEGE